MAVDAHFGATYADARQRFLRAAAACGARVDSRVHSHARGAAGEALAMDAALLGSADAPAIVVITSGTHGAEGFCGSGCQVALLDDAALLRAARDANLAILLVHAVNPFGFSHLRRVNEDNVDLNRNFRDWRTPPPRNPGYAAAHAVLVPETWAPTPANQQALAAVIAEQGLAGFQASVTLGQYEFPDGLFYGGSGPTWSNRTLRALLREHVAPRQQVAWIDVHTGLGPSGHGEKIYMGRDDAGDLARTRACFGADVTSFHEGSSVSAAVQGWIGLAAYDECPGTTFTGIGLEYGTVPLEEGLHALRGDHWLHLHPDAPEPLRASIKAAMVRAFYTDETAWRTRVVEQARAAAHQAIAHLVRTPVNRSAP